MSKRVVVVDDDPEVLLMMQSILRSKGYDIHAFGDPKQALVDMEGHAPDCAVVDLQMPGMSGMELIKRMRQSPMLKSTPILVVTGLIETGSKPDSYWAAGLKADEFMTKPFDPLALLSRVEYLLRRSNYISTGREGGEGEREATGEPAQAPPREVRNVSAQELTPEEVVRVFIESWNRRDFAAEYDTLADEMLGGLNRTEYIARREQLYHDQQGESITHAVLDAMCEISRNVAQVRALREDMEQDRPVRKEENYMLRRTSSGWKIVSVRSKPLPFTIE